MKGKISLLAERTVRLIFPTRCPFCNRIVEEACCLSCREQLIPVAGKTALPDGEAVIGACVYCGKAADAVIRMKFSSRSDLTEGLGTLIAEAVRKSAPDLPFDYVVPVPMTWREVGLRGYSQTILLAGVLSRRLQIPLAKRMLKKIRPTKPQHRLSRKERLTNVVGAYCVTDKKLLAGKRVLLCDDVLTTGATAGECAKTLKKAGALSVTAAVFAISQKQAEG